MFHVNQRRKVDLPGFQVFIFEKFYHVWEDPFPRVFVARRIQDYVRTGYDDSTNYQANRCATYQVIFMRWTFRTESSDSVKRGNMSYHAI